MKNSKKNWKYPFISFGILILCWLLIPLIRSYYNFHINIIVSLFSFSAYTYYVLKNTDSTRERKIKAAFILIPFTLIIFLSFFNSLVDYFPGLVFAPSIGIILAYLFVTRAKKAYKTVIAIIPVLLCIWLFTSFTKIWQDFMIYRTFGSGETLKESPNFTFYKENLPLTNENFKGKASVFFIWNTSCPYTPRYLLSLKDKYSKFSPNEKIEFYSVNIPMQRDSAKSDSVYLSNFDVNIERLKGPKIEEMYKVFGQAPIPLTIVLNPEGKIVYWGNIDKVNKTLEQF